MHYFLISIMWCDFVISWHVICDIHHVTLSHAFFLYNKFRKKNIYIYINNNLAIVMPDNYLGDRNNNFHHNNKNNQLKRQI